MARLDEILAQAIEAAAAEAEGTEPGSRAKPVTASDMLPKLPYRLPRGQHRGGWFTRHTITPEELLAKLTRKGANRSGRECWICAKLRHDPDAYVVAWGWHRMLTSEGQRQETRKIALLPRDRRVRRIKSVPGYTR